MPMPVVDIRRMGMRVHHFPMHMNMRVLPAQDGNFSGMLMDMVIVVMTVGMGMLHEVMFMWVGMPLGQHQPGTQHHDRQRRPK